MILRLGFTILALLAAGRLSAAATLHPQDGPHADLRVVIEDEHVRFLVGVNLAFLDEAVDEPREALGELSPTEADRVLDAFRALLTEDAACEIDGEPIEPEFERLEIFTNPDPGMIAVFPKMGTRALIRATAVLRYDAPEPPDVVELTWPAYPFDQLAEQMEQAGGVRPRMYFEAVLTADGKSSAARFTHAEPTMRWSRSESMKPDPLRNLPQPTTGRKAGGVPLTAPIFGGAALLAIAFAATRRARAAKLSGLAVAVVLGGLGFALRDHVGGRLGGETRPLVSEPDAQRVFLAIHESLYRAFDYTAESDIYDRLALALDGELLGQLYEQIRLSLLQAEEEMKVGVVTRLEPIETAIASIDPADRTPTGLGFDAVHRWRVDGTVYHWGHSHTRAHVYEAAYRVTYTDNGWRITEHQLLSQTRIDPETGLRAEDADPAQRLLERLGRPDI
ncbi:MAG: hypothetical protein RIB60_08150 [Phycisphaerales bacterium]